MPVIIKVNMTAKEITTVENPDYKLLVGVPREQVGIIIRNGRWETMD